MIGEFLGELNASHTYRGGGDDEQAAERSRRHARRRLGARQRRVSHRAIVRGGPWDTGVRSPLDEPGVDVKEGDYVLAVNGVALDHEDGSVGGVRGARQEDGGADGERDAVDGQRARRCVVTLPRRARSSCGTAPGSRSAGRSSTRPPAARSATSTCRAPAPTRRTRLMRQFMAQWKKEGLIIDERWNSGGQIPDRFIELLEPADRRLLGGARRPELAVAAGRAPRRAGDADQRLERIGRRRVSRSTSARPASAR